MSEVLPMAADFKEVEPTTPAKVWGRRRFRPGAPFESIHDLVHAINVGCWIYYRGTPKHPSILRNMSLGTLMGAVAHKAVRVAMENPK